LRMDKFSLDIQPTGHLILVMHRDRPKLVGQMGMILGEYGINIAGMQLDREEQGGKALMVLTIDQGVNESIMNQIRKIDDVTQATYVSF